ncbi:hypothetical protein RhiJN_23495 [Ceratobasidium sp. AG-Ba]|nr:hypothetical protein RhiJN_23495 [Ceratobasidium sp. AG-Ba]
MANAKNTKGKGKGPAHPRGARAHDDERQQQTRNAQLVLAKAKGRLVTSHAQDDEGDNEYDEGYDEDADHFEEEAEGPDSATYWPRDDDEGDYDDYAEPDPAEEDDPRTLRAVRDAQADEIRELKTAIEQSRLEHEKMMRRLERMSGATPGASGSASTSRAAAFRAAASVARPHGTSRTTIPRRSVDAPRTANASRPANVPRSANPSRPANTPHPIDGPRPASTPRLNDNPRPAPATDQPTERPGDLPPIVGVNAPRWIPFPEKDTDRTIARIRYGLGATDRETWLNMQDAARQVAGLCGFDFTKIWKRQSGDHLALGSRILEKRIPGLLNFEDRWATTRLLQTKFNHRRGHRLQAKREAEERALALELALDDADLDDPALARFNSIEPADAATMDLDDTEPEQPRRRIKAELPVSTGSYPNTQPVPQLKRRREESPNAPTRNSAFRPNPLASASFPQPKRARKTELPPSPEPELEPAPELELELEPEPEPEPELELEPEPKPKPKPKSKPAPKPKALAKSKVNGVTTSTAAKTRPTPGPAHSSTKLPIVTSTNVEPDTAAPARQRKLLEVDPSTHGSTAEPNGPTEDEPTPEPRRKRSIRPKMRPPPPPTPPPVDAADAANSHADHPEPNLDAKHPTRRQGLRSSNAALAAMDQTSAALSKRSAKVKKSAARLPSEPLEPEQPDDAHESDDGFHEAEGDADGA